MTENRGGTRRDRLFLFGGKNNYNGPGRDGKMNRSKVGGTGRRVHNSRRDGTVKFNGKYFHGGTGRSLFFSPVRRDGIYFFPRRDGTVNIFSLGGTGR